MNFIDTQDKFDALENSYFDIKDAIENLKVLPGFGVIVDMLQDALDTIKDERDEVAEELDEEAAADQRALEREYWRAVV